jgi:hypothetical protein
MPQLDSLTFFMQIFFTFLSFWVGFVYFRLFILAEIYVTLKQKQLITEFIIKIGMLIKMTLIISKIYCLKVISVLNFSHFIYEKNLKQRLLLNNKFLKLLNLLNIFIFKNFTLFNILKKIKIFNNILTLNFNSIYSSQTNSLFKNSNLIKFNSINSNNIMNHTLNFNLQQFKYLKLNFLGLDNIKKGNFKLKKNVLSKTLLNFQILKNLIILEKLSNVNVDSLKLLTFSNLLIKLNLLKTLSILNFNFYNETNLNYSNLLISNIKLTNL